jgi:hypothetical protein
LKRQWWGFINTEETEANTEEMEMLEIHLASYALNRLR